MSDRSNGVSWDPPSPGAYSRTFRFGEWISEPVTPLFETWLLATMEERLHHNLEVWVGQRAPTPHHVVVNGWYFYSLNWLSASAFARNAPRLLARLVRQPRRVAGLIPPTVRHSIPVFEQEWRQELQPRYRAAVERAEAQVDSMAVDDLPPLVDELASLAGDYFASVAALGGAAYKTEMNLARFYQRHLAGTLGGSHLPLLAGLEAPVDPAPHAVATLDWWYPPAADHAKATPTPAVHERLVGERRSAEQAAVEVLASSPRRLRTFRQLLEEAQHMAPIREEQAREFTLAWPVMRRAVQRMGEVFAHRRVVDRADDIFYLSRDEVAGAMDGAEHQRPIDTATRRAKREQQTRFAPPMLVGRVSPMARRLWESFPRAVGARPAEDALVTGTPASPGRATGVVRVIRGPDDFDGLQPGEILVAPLTTPAWTPLFTRAAAVVTDIGSPAAHASVIAREYGIPAVVGCGDATRRLRTGERVTVDGDAGNVESVVNAA